MLRQIEKVTFITGKNCPKCHKMRWWLPEMMRNLNMPFEEVDFEDVHIDFEVKLAEAGYTIRELPVIVAHRTGGKLQVWREEEIRAKADEKLGKGATVWNLYDKLAERGDI